MKVGTIWVGKFWNFFFVLTHVTFLVCVAVVKRFADSLDDTTRASPKLVEDSFKAFCKETKGKDNRFVSLENFSGKFY